MSVAEIETPASAGPESDAADAVIRTLTDVTRGAARFGEDAVRTLTRATYTSAYFMAYAAVFSAVLVVRALPRQNPVMKGFSDGGAAARQVLAESDAEKAAQ